MGALKWKFEQTKTGASLVKNEQKYGLVYTKWIDEKEKKMETIIMRQYIII